MMSSDIKLDSGMLDVLGGINGEWYSIYMKLCTDGVIILKKYFNIFFILFAQEPKVDLAYLGKFILSRFQPRQDDNVSRDEMSNIISKSNNAYGSYIKDFLHYHTQEKTVQTGLTQVLSNAINIVKGFNYEK